MTSLKGNIMAFPCLAVFITFCLILFFRYRYLDEKRLSQEQDFFDRERQASTTIGKISESDYEVIPLSKFPFNLCEDPSMLEMENEIQALSKEKLLDLTGISNTDVKLKYGVNHFDEAVAAGEKYDELLGLLVKYAIGLDDHGFSSESSVMLEYLIDQDCDIKAAWIALGKFYATNSSFDKLTDLYNKVDSSKLTIKNATKEQLAAMIPETPQTEQ